MKPIDAYKRDNYLVDIIFQHKGKDNVISSKEITAILNENGFKTRVDNIHHLVRKIVLERCLPICSVNANGYFWATTKEELQMSVDDLQSRIEEIQKRIAILKSFIME